MSFSDESMSGLPGPGKEDQDKSSGGEPRSVRATLSVLQREVQATHLLVWRMNVGGVLTSMRIPVIQIAQQIRLAGRILESNHHEAMTMTRAASQAFDTAARRWNAQAQQSEEKLRAARAMNRLATAKARHHATRTRIVPVQSLFQRAIRSLQDLDVRRRQKAEGDA